MQVRLSKRRDLVYIYKRKRKEKRGVLKKRIKKFC